MANRRGKVKAVRFPLLDLQNRYIWWLQPWNQKTITSWQANDGKPRQHVEKQRHYSANKVLYSQDYGVSSGRVQLWKLDLKEGRMPKNWCLQTVVLEKTPESHLDSKEIKPAPQFKGINSLAFCLLYGPALTTVHDHWEDHSLDYMDLCRQSNVSAFQHTV